MLNILVLSTLPCASDLFYSNKNIDSNSGLIASLVFKRKDILHLLVAGICLFQLNEKNISHLCFVNRLFMWRFTPLSVGYMCILNKYKDRGDSNPVDPWPNHRFSQESMKPPFSFSDASNALIYFPHFHSP